MNLEDQKPGKFEEIHDLIRHEGYEARSAGKLANENPYLQIACKERGEEYDWEKENSWLMGWCDGDRQEGMIIDGEKL